MVTVNTWIFFFMTRFVTFFIWSQCQNHLSSVSEASVWHINAKVSLVVGARRRPGTDMMTYTNAFGCTECWDACLRVWAHMIWPRHLNTARTPWPGYSPSPLSHLFLGTRWIGMATEWVALVARLGRQPRWKASCQLDLQIWHQDGLWRASHSLLTEPVCHWLILCLFYLFYQGCVDITTGSKYAAGVLFYHANAT